MNIDSHQHFWQFDPARDAWIDNSMKVIQRDFLPENLKPILEINNIQGCIAVQASQSLTETEFLLDLAQKHDFVKAVVGWIDLRAGDVSDQLAKLKNVPKLAGFRHIVQAEPDDSFVLRSDFQRGIKALGDSNFTYDLLVFPHQLPASIILTQDFPNQPFVLNHLAKPMIKNGKIDDWKRSIRKLAVQSNVYCKVSGIVTEADWNNWTYEEVIPYLDIVFETFGTDRIMFGSDWPVCLVAADYNEVKQIVTRYISSFTENEKRKIMGENARKFYKITH
jgi:L-fuconolactonase